ncbi:hypothetical protein [Bradyrhizobium sp. CCBAU 51627]|uniref:hypothetical protein n=1 Tax=Bradyrhizobium sp. CCBAU 51627 TaxID=1325088 RepID=UPI002306D40C|nr:hypothetical protein [Bradyrhizobium sp. CCBAU 51627]MDA9436351.1 hypothetical protein [Bradyrhizobium sp. CCBAU 51627]
MTESPEWKAIAVAATIACVSMSLLAIDAVVDLNFGGMTKRLERAQASFVDTLEQHQLAFTVPTWAPRQGCRRAPVSAQPVLTVRH